MIDAEILLLLQRPDEGCVVWGRSNAGCGNNRDLESSDRRRLDHRV
jgi:hypothetical protein